MESEDYIFDLLEQCMEKIEMQVQKQIQSRDVKNAYSDSEMEMLKVIHVADGILMAARSGVTEARETIGVSVSDYSSGFDDGWAEGWDDGYQDGYLDGQNDPELADEFGSARAAVLRR